jgi:predicted unusual protein kinase regulating ubiquinone biosynthesis (AarF/ABC1/UbiB family)
MLEISMKGLCLLQGGSSAMFMQQARHLMETELDYIKEVQTQQWFFENFKDHEFIVTPEVFGHMSTSTVIVSKYIDGESMLDFISHASQDAKNHIANQLFTFHIESFVGCRLYVDYHWGNMKVLDGDKLVMLDFGMCETVTGNVRNEFMVLSNLAIAKDRSGFLEQVKKNGYNVEKVGSEFYDVYEIFGRPRASPDFRYNQAYMDEINTILTGSCVGEMNEGALSVMRAELLLVHVMLYMGAQPNVHALHNKYDLKGCTV